MRRRQAGGPHHGRHDDVGRREGRGRKQALLPRQDLAARLPRRFLEQPGAPGVGDRRQARTVRLDLPGEQPGVPAGRERDDLEALRKGGDQVERLHPDRAGRSQHGHRAARVPGHQCALIAKR